MKKLLLTVAVLACALTLSVNAQEKKEGEKKRPEMTEEQKKLMKEITGKYDADKDGKLSKEEREKISQEDKDKMKAAGIGGRGGEKKKEDKK